MLLEVMLDQSTPASVRIRAAECIMNQSSKAIEIEDVEARVAELESPPEDLLRQPGKCPFLSIAETLRRRREELASEAKRAPPVPTRIEIATDIRE